jgi:hypothetical protein
LLSGPVKAKKRVAFDPPESSFASALDIWSKPGSGIAKTGHYSKHAKLDHISKNLVNPEVDDQENLPDIDTEKQVRFIHLADEPR